MKSRSWSGSPDRFVDPMTYFQAVRLLHYYSYSHVRPRGKLTMGEGATIAPNVSLRNGERIVIGAARRSASAPTSGRVTRAGGSRSARTAASAPRCS